MIILWQFLGQKHPTVVTGITSSKTGEHRHFTKEEAERHLKSDYFHFDTKQKWAREPAVIALLAISALLSALLTASCGPPDPYAASPTTLASRCPAPEFVLREGACVPVADGARAPGARDAGAGP